MNREQERWLAEQPAFRARFKPTHDRLDEIEQMEPGVTRVGALQAVRSQPVDAAAATRMKVIHAQNKAWLDAQDMITTTDMVEGHGYPLGTSELDRIEMTVHELAAALRISTAQASNEVAFHLYVGDRLAHGWVALNQGRLYVEHVKAIYLATEHCPAWVAAAVDAAIVPLAVDRRWTPAQIRKHARKVILSVDSDGANERARKAKADTDVEFYPENDEMGTVRAHGDAATARQVYDTINARAAQLGRDPLDARTAGQRRFDALAEFVLGPRDTTTAPDDGASNQASPAQQRARRRGQAQIRLDLTTALGLDDNPGYLDGYGPITAQLARDLAADANWRRWITDPLTGELLDLGRTTYTPSKALREFIEALHPTCSMIGCERPARQSQIDHKTEWDTLGRTDRANLQPLCQRHHQQKTKKHWTLNQHPDGDTWTSPLGFTYRRDDRPYDIPAVDPPDPDHDEYPEHPDIPEQLVPPDDLTPPYPDNTYEPDAPLPDEPPLDPYETQDLYNTLEHNFAAVEREAYNVLRAAQLID